jgi:hypothetical protein
MESNHSIILKIDILCYSLANFIGLSTRGRRLTHPALKLATASLSGFFVGMALALVSTSALAAGPYRSVEEVLASMSREDVHGILNAAVRCNELYAERLASRTPEQVYGELSNAMISESLKTEDGESRYYVETALTREPNHPRLDRVRCMVEDRERKIVFVFVPFTEFPQELIDKHLGQTNHAVRSTATRSQLQMYERQVLGFGSHNLGRDMVLFPLDEISPEKAAMVSTHRERDRDFFEAAYAPIPEETVEAFNTAFLLSDDLKNMVGVEVRPRPASKDWWKGWKKRFLPLDRGHIRMVAIGTAVSTGLTCGLTYCAGKLAGLDSATASAMTTDAGLITAALGGGMNLFQPVIREVYKTGTLTRQYFYRLIRTMFAVTLAKHFLQNPDYETTMNAFMLEALTTSVSAQWFNDSVRNYVRFRRDSGDLLEFVPLGVSKSLDSPYFGEVRLDVFLRMLVIYPSKKTLIFMLDQISRSLSPDPSHIGEENQWGTAGSLVLGSLFRAGTFLMAQGKNKELKNERATKIARGEEIPEQELNTEILFGPYGDMLGRLGRFWVERKHHTCKTILDPIFAKQILPRDETLE